MMENYEHYITKNIKDVCRTKMISPIIYLILLLALWILSPISEIVVPEKADSNDSLTKLYKQDVSYIDTKLTDLYFTGYTPVSYTHLDVYKRQDAHISRRSRNGVLSSL